MARHSMGKRSALGRNIDLSVVMIIMMKLITLVILFYLSSVKIRLHV